MNEADSKDIPAQGLLARAIGIVVSPGETFRAVVKDPKPVLMLFFVALAIGLATGLPQFTEQGRQAALDMQVQQIEQFTGQPVTPEMYAEMEQRTQSNLGAYMTIGSVFIFLPVATMFFTALYWFFFNVVLGGTASFRQVLGVVSHSQVITALGAVVALPIQLMQSQATAAGPFNLGALAPMLAPGPLANFLGAISFFTLWQQVVCAIGLGVLYHRKSTGIAVALIVLTLAVAAFFTFGISAITGR